MIYSAPKLQLPDVTLFMADTCCTDLSILAMEKTLKLCDFGRVLVFSHEPDKYPFGEKYQVPVFASVADYSRLLWYEVPNMLNTSHLMMLQWDSWALRPWRWTNDFLKVDYIGAPWGDGIGNSGFSMRSKRLMDHLVANRGRYPLLDTENEDKTLCRSYRPYLEAEGFRWPDEALAARFSYEWHGTPGACFGFHGIFNWPYFLNRDELNKFIGLAMANPYIRKSKQWALLLQSMKIAPAS